MPLDLSQLSPRARSWNHAISASPGDLDLRVPAARVEGVIPSSLRGGRLLSNGPGWTLIGERLAHPFDGHGYVRSFAFTPDGALELKARFVRTEVFVDERRAGRLVHRGLATNISDRPWHNLGFSGTPRNVANTTIYPWAGRLLAGWEGGEPYGLDPVTLETTGPQTFGGLLKGQVSLAHMHRDAARGRVILCSVTRGRTSVMTLRELDERGELVQQRVGALPRAGFAHDFAFSDRWYVLGGNPLAFKPLELAKAALGRSTLLRALKTDLQAPGTLVLIPRDRQGETRVVRLPTPAFVVHFVNAFERARELVVDVCVFHRFEFGEEFGYRGPREPLDPTLPELRGAQRMYRVTIPEGAEEARWRQLAPHGIDFPRVHPAHEGRETPMMVGACRADTRFSDPFDSVIRVDLEDLSKTPELWTAPEHVFVGEPVVAPARDGGPDHVLALLSDGLRARTTLAILRADAIAEGPVARVHLPLLPIAFHGDWEPAPAS